MTDQQQEQQNLRTLEALLFASPEPLSASMIQERLGDEADIAGLVAELQESYSDRGVNLVETDGAWSFRTAPDLAGVMQITTERRRKLPRVAAETLAIVAYHQPITRAEIESIRGVSVASETLELLLGLGWVRPGRRRETPGRPFTWVTTQDFLSHFNLAALTDLPGIDDLRAAGLLDARPVLEAMPANKEDNTLGEDAATWNEEEDRTFDRDETMAAAS
ncbi:MAG: SMC-Scp complex subunit ScpB [Alphaproteobacteria bacterium]|nr:SMC-Scp complex subunit ScpB [Alphaproteobacteria bacterium]